MSVRSRSGGTVVTQKAAGSGLAVMPQPGPQDMMAAAEGASLMGSQNQFSPGLPIQPSDGYGRTPRSWNYTTSYNVATRPRTHERVSFPTLRGLIEAYDVAQIAIDHRIDSIRSLDWKLIAADGFTGDVADAVPVGMAALAKPDRESAFSTWLAKYLYDVLAFDAGALYRLRNRAGRTIGLSCVDGSTIAPLLDYWGNSPQEPAEAYVQYANGVAWNWLTRGDLIYEPYRPRSNSPYGRAPIESVLLNANTDLRFQVYFLQRFTEGNVPEAFASAPETWDPTQIEQWQAIWNTMMYGDQAKKHQIQWLPGGSTFTWSNEKDFSDKFSLFLMRKTCASFHVVPSDLGFTEDVNRSSGESQADVQHRVGDLPLGRHVEGILSRFLANDLGLPLKFTFDWGEEQDDRLAQAQADDIYIKNGTIGSSDIREMRYGLAEPNGKPVPRFIYTERGGPIPLAALFALAGDVDPETAAPVPGSHLPHEAFPGVEGVMPTPPVVPVPLAEQEFGPKALPAAPPPQPGTVAKEAAAGPTVGITSETGITSYDLIGRDDEDEDRSEAERAAVAKAEMAAFRSFRQKRRRAGEWRDFEFRAVDAVAGHNLNDAGRLAVRKAAGEVAVAGLAVRAADTGRVLMIQRALDPADPAGGFWEFPGGHMEGDERPITAAAREWCEETGCILPFEPEAMAALSFGNGAGWTSANGIYAGFVYPVQSEASVPVRSATQVTNPDDPDSDQVEAIAWWDPADLPGNPAIRAELLADLPAAMAALAPPCCGAPCCDDGCCGGTAGCQCGTGPVAKAGEAGPKGRSKAEAAPAWPGWRLSDQAAAYWAPLLTAQAATVLSASVLDRMASAYLAANPGQDGTAPGKQDRNEAAYAWLVAWLAAAGISLDWPALATGILADGYLIGAVSAEAVTSGTKADLGGWQPGEFGAAQERAEGLGLGATLAVVLAASAVTAVVLAAGFLWALARVLAGADGGDDPASVAADLGSAVADPGLAEGAALDQLYTGCATGAHDDYCGGTGESPPGDWSWEVDPSLSNCLTCLDNAVAEPRPFDDPWPSGDVDPPVHRLCGCIKTPAAER